MNIHKQTENIIIEIDIDIKIKGEIIWQNQVFITKEKNY
jgi:hypothetical protein